MRFKIKLAETLSIAALLVAMVSAGFSYQQTVSTINQLRLAELQIRPYVKYIPEFVAEGADRLTVNMHSENLSAIPANVIYSRLTAWADWESNGVFWDNKSGDILYEHKGGQQTLPPFQKELAGSVLNGESVLMVGTCVVYSPISTSDVRRWEVKSLYGYEPGRDLPTVHYMREDEVPGTTSRCEARDILDLWVTDKSNKLRNQ